MNSTRRMFCAGLGAALTGSLTGARAMSNDTVRAHRIRHYVIASPDLDATCEAIYDFLDLAPTPPREGPSPTEQFGFTTRMMQIGNTLLEVVQPIRAQHTLHEWMAENGGPGGYMVVLQTFDAAALKARAAAQGLTLTRDMMFRGQHMIQFDYRHFGTHFELYQYTPEDNWWGDPLNRNYPQPGAVREVAGCQVLVDDPDAIAAQIAQLFLGEQRGTSVTFEQQTVSFGAAVGRKGLAALELVARDPSRAGDRRTISGLELRIS